jgi:hypothetical protein
MDGNRSGKVGVPTGTEVGCRAKQHVQEPMTGPYKEVFIVGLWIQILQEPTPSNAPCHDDSDRERTADWFRHSVSYADPNMDIAPGDLVDFHGSRFVKFAITAHGFPFWVGLGGTQKIVSTSAWECCPCRLGQLSDARLANSVWNTTQNHM